jgi:hypothetical protein
MSPQGEVALENEAASGVAAFLETDSGQPIDPSVRDFFEPRFGHDFSGVRVHTGERASASASSVGAVAYTAGSHIVFRDGSLSPGTDAGQKLLAHELAHVVQQEGGARSDAVQRQVSSAEEYRWKLYGHGGTKGDLARLFQGMLSYTPERALEVLDQLAKAGPPETDAEREAFKVAVTNLVRLHALSLMAAHRATIQGSQERMVGAGDAGIAGLRVVASLVQGLFELRSELQGYSQGLHRVATDSRQGRGDISDWLDRLAANVEQHIETWVQVKLGELGHVLRTQPMTRSEQGGLISIVAMQLEDWRGTQIGVVNNSLGAVYSEFPFFAKLEASRLAGSELSGAAAGKAAVRKAYVELLAAVDDAIVRIATMDIDPFELPQAVSVTRDALPKELLPSFDQVIRHREVEAFLENMAITMGLTVLGVTTLFFPALGLVAASAGGLMLGGQLEEMLDRVAIAGASTNPEKQTLGVTAPGGLEWGLFAIQGILTIVDAGLALHGLRTPKLPPVAAEAEVGARQRVSTSPRETPPHEAPSGGRPPENLEPQALTTRVAEPSKPVIDQPAFSKPVKGGHRVALSVEGASFCTDCNLLRRLYRKQIDADAGLAAELERADKLAAEAAATRDPERVRQAYDATEELAIKLDDRAMENLQAAHGLTEQQLQLARTGAVRAPDFEELLLAGMNPDDAALVASMYRSEGTSLATALTKTGASRDEVLATLQSTSKKGNLSTLAGRFKGGRRAAVTGRPDNPHELVQAIDLTGRQGGEVQFRGKQTRGIEGVYIPPGTTDEVPVSLKVFTSERPANVVSEIESNARMVSKEVGDGKALLFAYTRVKTAELLASVQNSLAVTPPMLGAPTTFQKVVIVCPDGVIEGVGTHWVVK